MNKLTQGIGYLLALLIPSTATAHSFGAGTDQFASFVEGASVVLFDQVTLFAALSLGLIIALWQRQGVIVAIPLFVAGLLLGFLLAPSAQPWVIVGTTVTGAVTATLAASLNQQIKVMVLVMALLTGLFCQFVSLLGHTWLELSAAIYIGVSFGALLPVMMGAAVGEVMLEKLPSAFAHIAVRVAASWLAAIQIMMLAFFTR